MRPGADGEVGLNTPAAGDTRFYGLFKLLKPGGVDISNARAIMAARAGAPPSVSRRC